MFCSSLKPSLTHNAIISLTINISPYIVPKICSFKLKQTSLLKANKTKTEVFQILTILQGKRCTLEVKEMGEAGII